MSSRERDVVLVASGDSRLLANQRCWPAQEALEAHVSRAFAELGRRVVRGHPVEPVKRRVGVDAAEDLDPPGLAGLVRHRGPILTLANWSGEWPGLVGMLNVNASMTKGGIPYSSLRSEDFRDAFAKTGLRRWLEDGAIIHDTSHARPV